MRIHCRLVSTGRISVRAKETLQLDAARISATHEGRCCRLGALWELGLDVHQHL
jgi:hypothetical protein